MTRKVSVVVEGDEHGCYAWCPELEGCQSQGKTVEETLANIREAIELYLETLTDDERSAALSAFTRPCETSYPLRSQVKQPCQPRFALV